MKKIKKLLSTLSHIVLAHTWGLVHGAPPPRFDHCQLDSASTPRHPAKDNGL